VCVVGKQHIDRLDLFYLNVWEHFYPSPNAANVHAGEKIEAQRTKKEIYVRIYRSAWSWS